jgi:hypothetical protein
MNPYKKLIFLLLLVSSCFGQVAVNSVTYGVSSNGANRNVDEIRYLNQTSVVSTINTTLGDYQFTGPVADNVFFRRNTGTTSPNNSTVFYQYNSLGSPNQVIGAGDTTPTLSEVMLSGDLSQGIRNPFANGTSAQNTNIERMDFYFSGGYTVQANDALVFFDLENQNNFGDGFRIAAYTSVDGAGTPTAYANSGLLVASDSFGGPVGTPDGTNGTYLRSTTTFGDNLYTSPTNNTNQTVATVDTNSGTLGANDLYLVGILIRMADLGLSPGQTIYGYSLMAGDVTATTGTQLVNWNNATYYPTNTDSAGYGNMDFMGFGAQVSRPVPEPSTYGAIFIAVSIGFVFIRRKMR